MKRNEINFVAKPIHHLSIADAINLELISKKSPVYKFFETYLKENEVDFTKKFKMVIYTGSEMIGPSVQVAELAGCITEQLMKIGNYNSEKNSFRFLDIFSGSSATTIPSAFKFKNNPSKYLTIERIDDHPPEKKDDYLEMLFKNITNIELDEYKEKDIFKLIKDGEINKAFPKHYDLCVADPPHYLTLNFLLDKQQGCKCIGEILADKVGVFIIYYAHKEQKSLCKQIRLKLKLFYENVYQVVVGSEEMAVCFNNDNKFKSDIYNGLGKFKELCQERYGISI